MTRDSIYKVEVVWHLAGHEACQMLPMLVVGKDVEDAIKNLKAELLKNPDYYKVDPNKSIDVFEAKHLGYFMYPKLVEPVGPV